MYSNVCESINATNVHRISQGNYYSSSNFLTEDINVCLKTYPRKHARVFRKFDQGIRHKSMQLYLRGRKESDTTKRLN